MLCAACRLSRGASRAGALPPLRRWAAMGPPQAHGMTLRSVKHTAADGSSGVEVRATTVVSNDEGQASRTSVVRREAKPRVKGQKQAEIVQATTQIATEADTRLLQTPDRKESRKRRSRAAPAAPSPVVDAAPVPLVQAAVVPITRVVEQSQEPAWTQETLQQAVVHLSAVDSGLAPIIAEAGFPSSLLPTITDTAFGALARSIVYQQLATGAARAIFLRVVAACQCTETLLPAAVLGVPMPTLRTCGLSERKASYLLDLASRFASDSLTTQGIAAMQDEELYEQLTAVRGIGRWSVDMFAMFHLGRPDILPVGDLGVRRGFQTLYKLPGPPTVEQMESISEKWKPFRSLGSYYMWRVPTPPRAPAKGKKRKPAATAEVTEVAPMEEALAVEKAVAGVPWT